MGNGIEPMDLLNLTDRKILITGGTRGIGKATAIALARAGAQVVVNYHSNRAAAEETLAEVRALGGVAYALGADVTDPEAAAELVERAAEAMGGLDGLVHCAGVPAKVFEGTPETWRRVVAAHLDSTYYVCDPAGRAMAECGVGAIVVVSSIAAHQCGPNPYSAAMAGKIAYAKGLARQLAPRGVRVNLVSPGCIYTDMWLPETPESFREKWQDRIPLSAHCGGIPRGEHVAGTIVYLLCDLSAHVTGQDIEVNGGQRIDL